MPAPHKWKTVFILDIHAADGNCQMWKQTKGFVLIPEGTSIVAGPRTWQKVSGNEINLDETTLTTLVSPLTYDGPLAHCLAMMKEDGWEHDN